DIERGQRTVSEPQKRSFLASLFRRYKDAEEVEDNASARETASISRGAAAKSETRKSDGNKAEPSKLMPARIQLASAAEPVVAAVAPVPLPPRRPLYQVAESRPPLPTPAPREAAPIKVAALTPNQIVDMRGLWESSDNPTVTGKLMAATNALSVSSARRLVAHRSAPAYAAQDRVPPDVALAYAAENDAG